MPPKKARFGNRGKGGGESGKGGRGYGSGRGSWRGDYRDRDSRPYWRDDYDHYGDWGDRGGPHQSWEDETRGVMAPLFPTHATIDLQLK